MEAETKEMKVAPKKEEKKLTREERLEAYGKRLQQEIGELKGALKFAEEANRVLQVEVTTLKGELAEAKKEKDRVESAIRALDAKYQASRQEGVARGKKAFKGESQRLRAELEAARGTIRSLNAKLADPNRQSNAEKEAMEIAARTKVTLDARDADLKDYRAENLRLRNRIGELEEKLENPLSIEPKDLKSKDKK